MNELPIVYSIDDNYAQHCAASMASLLSNVSDKYAIHIFIISESLTEDNREKLQKITEIKKCELSFLTIDGEHFKKIYMPPRWPKSVLFRLKIPTLLKDYSRAIYLDSDTIIEGDIAELFDSAELRDHLLGAVNEHEINKGQAIFQAQRIKIPFECGYFNSGVLLLNIDRMRKCNFEAACFSVLGEKRKNLIFPDQDILNIVANGNYLHLSLIWNLQVGSADILRMVRKHKCHIKIIHFTCELKPWHVKNSFLSRNHPHPQVNLSSKYYKYLALTPWKNFKAKSSLHVLFRKLFSFFDPLSLIARHIFERKLEKCINNIVNARVD